MNAELLTNIATIAAAVHIVALVVVNITPTPKDNEAVKKAYVWIERVAGIITNAAKQKQDNDK